MLLKLLHHSLQAETDARFAEVQQQLVQKDGEIRELRVRIHCNKIKALIVAQTLKCCALVVHTGLIPRPCQTFCHFQYGKWERAPGIFSHVSDVRIEKMVERV